MAVGNMMHPLEWLREHVADADPDLVRSMLSAFAEQLMAADAQATCNAGYGERSPERTNRRNGYRSRAWDTRVGTIGLAVPKLRQGSYFPHFLLEPRRRAEQAMVGVVAQCYVEGVSTEVVPVAVEVRRVAVPGLMLASW